MKFVRPPLFSILLLASVLAGAIFFLPHAHKANASGPQTWYIRPDGGTRYDANVPNGQCDGLADVAYPGTGVDQHCAFNDFRYMWDDDSGVVGSGSWVMAGGDTVIIRGCTALPTATNPANPDCRLGWDGPWGGNSDNWCYGVGSYTCYNPPIPAGTPNDPTRILGQNYANCATGGQTNPKNYESQLTQLFGGFSLTYTFNLQNTQNVQIECIELTTHNGQCTWAGSPHYPRGCSNNQPLDDYAQNGFMLNNQSANITFQDVYVHGFNSSGFDGPIGGAITMLRVFDGFNGFAGWNFDDGQDTPDTSNSSINANYVIMEGNGCYEQYPIVNTAFPARACYDDLSNGFGDSWSGQDSPMASFTCNHCVQEYNTKDGFIGPHTQIGNLTIENSASIGNMGAEWKWDDAPGGSVTFVNNLTVGDCTRMAYQIPGAPQNFAESTGLPGSYLSDFCRAAGNSFALLTQSNSTVLIADNTIVTDSATVFQLDCGPPGGGADNCQTASIVVKNNILLGYTNTDSSYPQAPGLFYLSDPSIIVSSTNNIEYGNRNGDPCGGSIICSDPLLGGEPSQSYTNETAFDNLNFTPLSGSPAIGAGIVIPAITTDYYGTTRTNPPTMGAIEAGSSGGSSPPASDTTPPSTSVTSLSNSASVSGTISVSASASDNVGVTSVGFYVDGSLKSTDSSSPYSFSLDTTTLSNGTHTIYTKAYDAAGNVGTSATITFTVNNAVGDTTPPSIPTGLAVTGVTSSSVSLSWTASTDNVGVAGYNIYRGGTKIATSNSASYTNTDLSVSTAYTYTISSYDAAGNTSAQSGSVSATTNSAGSSNNPSGPSGYVFCALEGYTCSFSGTMSVAYGAGSSFNYLTLTNGTSCANSVFTDPDVGVGKACFTKSVSDTTPPTTSITAPSSGATESGIISVIASASDNVGVTSVGLYVDGSLQGTDNTSPYAFSLNTATLSNGSHTLSTKAYDAAGNVGTSGNTSITVSNTIATTPVITPPVTQPSSGGGGGGGGTSVSIAPSFEITSVSISNVTPTSAQITVTTHVPASVVVKYGKITLYNMSTGVSPLLVTNHENLTGLMPDTIYDFVVIATPLGGSAFTSQTYTLSTLSAPGTIASASGTTGSSSLSATSSAFTQNVAYGDTGTQVTLLQNILHAQGFLAANYITGYFGTQTEHALLLFQSAHDLNKSGFVDDQSQALLNKVIAAEPNATIVSTPASSSVPTTSPTGSLTQNLAPGSTGVQVTILQHILNADGDYPSAIYTQFYGSLTEAAVKIFQAKYGIATYGAPGTTGYGAVGPKTRAKLNGL